MIKKREDDKIRFETKTVTKTSNIMGLIIWITLYFSLAIFHDWFDERLDKWRLNDLDPQLHRNGVL